MCSREKNGLETTNCTSFREDTQSSSFDHNHDGEKTERFWGEEEEEGKTENHGADWWRRTMQTVQTSKTPSTLEEVQTPCTECKKNCILLLAILVILAGEFVYSVIIEFSRNRLWESKQ